MVQPLIDGIVSVSTALIVMNSPPPVNDMCLSVTSYWVWDSFGDIFPGWEGQCNEDCSLTAAGYELPPRAEEYTGGYAACIQDWTKLKGFPTKVVKFDDFRVYCVDNFGDPNYRAPFYHDYYQRWVIPVDILAEGVHELQCNWTLEWGNVPED